MQRLMNKHILLGVSGGIAAYKSAELVRLLTGAGAQVRVAMTRAAQEFITPMTLQALSGNPVHTSVLDPEAEAGMGHIELARWADLILVAPATANLMAQLALGAGNDLLTTVCLASKAPIALAPAMNQIMWEDARTQKNREILSELGILIWGPAHGVQACGDIGPGRMLEPAELSRLCADQFYTGLLAGKHLVITAGPTCEAIDPVRYISNHSSGKMGYALAEAAVDAGARVTLISGPVNISVPESVEVLRVTSAQEMYQASMALVGGCDIFIAAAAVADYTPDEVQHQKIKKHSEVMTIRLKPTIDIVSRVAALENRPFTVGFAAETQNVTAYARDKLIRKKLDLIIANDVSRADIGFNSDDNAVTLIDRCSEYNLPKASKRQLAVSILKGIAGRLNVQTVEIEETK